MIALVRILIGGMSVGLGAVLFKAKMMKYHRYLIRIVK